MGLRLFGSRQTPGQSIGQFALQCGGRECWRRTGSSRAVALNVVVHACRGMAWTEAGARRSAPTAMTA